uniref:Pre-mRNA-splicing factor 18 n=1 Tax=Pyramimonas obovata TaxID=1411642 RepID=A0A7S0QTU4_9CHLO|mmetsp:Transcript_107/g.245  ORF Transcript_107/g.245 Transcript_107/m.245 type:complete len:451 (+) Transcript_107:225-1577(+)|eukprot:CAMPEP_0118947808 /NCGR_PEP_ID=MMETSP1169-20130426/46688_1 /TAXON_ID=36882 /ORGANISM="Pyramimonas obovata, Strain CCMP722" /LENGTH=450 /DNA_ID=CAMNT_0006894095 /DNA_START=161 /DNA_END=1513 /DNA_ORIENTATION=-
MAGMAGLAAAMAGMKRQKQQEFGGKKFVKRSEIEAVRQARLREEQAKEDERKGRVGKTEKKEESSTANPAVAEVEAATSSASLKRKEKEEAKEPLEVLPKEEVIRRLRALGQPATLFAESEDDRHRRLLVAAKNISVTDDTGGQQNDEMGARLRNMSADERLLAKLQKRKADKLAEASEAATDEPAKTTEEQELEAQFAAAAAELAKKRAEENMSVGDRITVFFKHITDEWGLEIEKMDESYLFSMEGKLLRATYDFSVKNLKLLYRQLRQGTCPEDLQRGLWLVVEAMKRRDYREAMDVYLRISIGNAPWPIGVTMVGIHERSAREKIGAQSQAHIMHDEASRKYLQSVKRCISFCQRRYPANPSRTIDFNLRVFGDDLTALKEAEDRGEDVDIASHDHNVPKDKWGNRSDGWKAQDRDNRTLSAVLRSAYEHEDDVKNQVTERQLVMK